MSESYSALGDFFEYLNADCDYNQWSQYLLNKLKSCGDYKTGLDIGCGNGYFTRAFNKAGYMVDGADISPAMLSVARQKAAKEGVRCEFLLCDIAKLKVLRKVDFITAVNDCLNYVPPQNLLTAFCKVHSSLKSGGCFLFDISSENKLRCILGDNMFANASEDISYIWFNEQIPGGVKMELTFYVKGEGGLYKRFDETHIQYAHREEEVLRLLKQAGFSRVFSEGHLGTEDKSQRIQFTAIK